MALHLIFQRVILAGAKLYAPNHPIVVVPPDAIAPLIRAIDPVHREFSERAVEYGHRYRSAYWTIYLLSALAVLCAVLPLALGWDDQNHALHPLAGLWTIAEVLIIATVGTLYWQGHREDWQGQWLSARTLAELTRYLPLTATLVDFSAKDRPANWYERLFNREPTQAGLRDVTALCKANETLARELLDDAWSDPQFVTAYVRWARSILEEQQQYHAAQAARHHALLHRVHRITTWLFGLTGVGALMHLVVHSLWLTLLTTFFPALGASLHGALAQSESYRLKVSSERLSYELGLILSGLPEVPVGECRAAMQEAVKSALALILDEHQDWHMLVRPHHLPLG